MKRLVMLAFLFIAACNGAETAQPQAVAEGEAEGDPQRGRQLVTQYGCHICHVIPGIDAARGTLGPSLQGVAARPAISFGTVQNTPANLTQFIRNPASLNPQSSMPPLDLAGNDAQDIAAFLMTLR